MSAKTYHFISGMPRSGSTLLCNILAQNPQLNAVAPPGILDVMFLVRHRWNRIVEFRAAPNEPGKLRVLRGILASYYAAAGVTEPVVLDKSRAWLGMIEMAETVLGRPVKILVPVRDVRDVMASFEKLWRQIPAMRELTAKGGEGADTPLGRCEIWARGDHPIGLQYNRIRDAVQRGYRDRLHFVEYEALTREPEATLAGIHRFLGLDPFSYNYNDIRQATWDIDEMYAVPGLPRVRAALEPAASQWQQVLGSWADRYGGHNQLWWQLLKGSRSAAPSSLTAAPVI
jgi:sulfotransferase